jgi:hypothetical protein
VQPGNTLTVSDLQSSSSNITKNGAGALTTNEIRAGALAISDGTVAILSGSAVSRVSALSLSGPAATLDLNDNDLIIQSGDYAQTTALVSQARNGGAWDEAGITSTAARIASPKNKTLGVVTGAQYLSTGNILFGGLNVAASDLLIKSTYYGDTDLNGIVNFDDYARIDAGFNNNGTDWFRGDFDFNGNVNFDDYALIDLAFNSQSGTLIRAMDYLEGEDRSLRGMDRPELQMVIDHFAQFGVPYAQSFLSAVPEPAAATAYIAAMTALATRRRRRVPAQ